MPAAHSPTRSLAAALVLCLAAQTASAQLLRGTVRDSTSRAPIPGAVLLLLDSAGGLVARNITNERGEYAVALSPAMQRLRVQRIGFRPREARISRNADGNATIEIAMPRIPTFLEPVRVTGNNCSRRADDGSAISLLEQARAGLLATIVAREASPAKLVLYAFERTMDGVSDRMRRQAVTADSGDRLGVSFSTVRDAQGFVRRGFMDDVDGQAMFYAPDADVLLNDAFFAGYCFRVVKGNKSRPNQVGLGFVAADRREGRVDIDGTLWIDTAARALRDIQFRYVGLDRRIEQYEPGGSISFREMPNGVVLVDRWVMRLIGTRQDSLRDNRSDRTRVFVTFYGHENGGELAHATWPDGTSWHAPLGTLQLDVLRSGKPAAGLSGWLLDTPYRATTDSAGRLVMTDLVPGPYSFVVIDSALRPLRMQIPTKLRFTSNRDTARVSVVAPTLDDLVVDWCFIATHYRQQKTDDTTRVLARVMAADGRAVSGVRFGARMNLNPDNAAFPWIEIGSGAPASSDGVIPLCNPKLVPGATVEIAVTQGGLTHPPARIKLAPGINILPVVIDPRP